MEYRQLGASDLTVSALALGMMNLNEKFCMKKVRIPSAARSCCGVRG